jgi:hypothetical protein
MGVEITTQIAHDVTSVPSAERRTPAPSAPELQDIVEEFGVSFRRLHPDTDDPVLSSYFIVDVPDPALAPRVLDRLRRSPVVSAAYIKGPDAMP